MKRIFAGALALFSALSFGATLNPIQLLSPTGSTAGQAIISTGGYTAPAWGSVTISGLAAIAANTVLANATEASAAPTAFAMPSCSASGNALKWTSGTGFGCATGYASLASPTFTGTVTTAGLTATGLVTMTNATTSSGSTSGALVVTGGVGVGNNVFVAGSVVAGGGFTGSVAGTTTNNTASAGTVGEYPAPATTTSTSLTTATVTNCTSKSLTAGDWDVQSVILYTPTGTTSISDVYAGVSTTSGTIGAFGSYTKMSWAPMVPANTIVIASPVVRVSIASTTTVYAIGRGDFSASTLTCDGFIRARRPW